MKSTLFIIIIFVQSFFVLGCPLTSHDSVGNDDNTTKKHDLKILSWNIMMLPYVGVKNANRPRAEAIAKELIKTDYDIIFFQEAFDKRSREKIREVLQKNFPFLYGPANKTWKFSLRANSGLWVLSRIPMKIIKEIEFSQASGMDSYANKGALLLEGNSNGHLFQIITTHIQSDDFPFEIRLEQMQEISKKLIQPFSRVNIPLIICGDMNTDKSQKDHYQKMLQTLSVEDSDLQGLLNVSFASPGNEITQNTNEQPRQIDYILIRNHEIFKSIIRKIALITHSWGEGHQSLSDHNGIEATIDFGQPAYLSTIH
jgi:endonuclease/exonuclease/phosphatase family metal-dependent hydrolase